MPGIYISHRRRDGDAHARRLFDALSARLGPARVFTGATAIAPGRDFVESIDAALRGSEAVLVVIGRDWLNAAGPLDDPDDFVRREVAMALRQNLRVIPVLVDGARMPRAEQLPDDLKPLARCAAVVLSDGRWEDDVASLERSLSVLSAMSAPRAAPAPMAATPGVGSVLQRGWQQVRRLWHREEQAGAASEPATDLDLEGPPTGWPRPIEPPRMESEAASGAEPPPMSGAEPEPAASAPAPPPAPSPADGTPEPVLLGASAPRIVRPGDEFTARFVAYVAAEEPAVRRTLAGLGTRNESHLGLKTCQWRPGTALIVRLVGRGLKVSPAEQPFLWDSTRILVEFDVTVPDTVALGTIVLKFDVLLAGVTVAMLRLDLEIAAQKSAGSPAEENYASGGAARTAFASYSSKDRQRVLDRIDAVRIAAGLDIFLDCLSLNPSESWKQRLDREIPDRDLFMLFWSADAAKSEWVEWEWRRALALKGLDAMQIHPLENGVKPPPELGDLHFGSVAMYARGPGG